MGLRGLLLWGVASLLASVSMVRAQGFFPRGDANCSLAFTVADLVAVNRSAGASICDNDDCDRNGVVNAADVECEIACLFDECPTPPNAPEVTGIELETGEEVTPYSTIHVIGDNVGSEDRLKRVTFNGVDAEIVEFIPPDELVLVVPPLAPGLVQMAIHDGDLIGALMAVDLAAQAPIGDPDTLETTFELLDEVAARFLELPLDADFGEDALLVGSAIESFREELQQQRIALITNPDFTPSVRAELDAAFDSSGVPEQLREILADIEAITSQGNVLGGDDGGSGAQAGTVVNVARKWGKTLKVARGALNVARAVGVAGAVGVTTGLSAPAAAIAVVTGVVAGVLTLAGSAALPPVLLGVTFATASAIPVGGPTPNGFAIVRGRRMAGTNLVLRTAGGTFSVPAQVDNDTTRQYRLPGDLVGFCGRVDYYLERTFAPGISVAFPDGIIPQLESFVGSTLTVPGQVLGLRVHGVSGCLSEARFTGGPDDEDKFERAQVLNPTRADVRVANVAPGEYRVAVVVHNRQSEPLGGLMVESGVEGVAVVCEPRLPGLLQSELLVRPGTPNEATCTATAFPDTARLPPHTYFHWRSSDPETADLELSIRDDRRTVNAKLPGRTLISAVLMVEQRSLATTLSAWQVRVADVTPPSVSLSSSLSGSVPAGSALPVRVSATDNVFVTRVLIRATGDPVLNGEQESTCDLERSCAADFAVNIDRTFDRNQVTIVAEAFDGSGNMATSNQLSFTVEQAIDETCPSLTIASPADGGTVNAGSGNQVVANATDEIGVKRFVYSASGDALVGQVSQALTFPDELASADLRFGFNVKEAAALRDVANRNIVITVEAFDVAGNTCGAQTRTVSVIGVLDNCQGSIVTNNPADFIGEPFTITVTIIGPTAAEITRVTSINPGGQFDLTARGNGVFEVTLFYQGTGGFTLSFTAFDAQGNDRCSGSIGLESLGPEP